MTAGESSGRLWIEVACLRALNRPKGRPTPARLASGLHGRRKKHHVVCGRGWSISEGLITLLAGHHPLGLHKLDLATGEPSGGPRCLLDVCVTATLCCP